MGINFNYNFNIPKVSLPKVSFGQNSYVTSPLKQDSYNPDSAISKYMDESSIKSMMYSNPKVMSMLQKHGITPNVNMAELKNLAQNHLNDTKQIALGIYNELPEEMKSKINKQALMDAAILHDFGKVLIPNSILNKKGALTQEEKEIMQLHSELGYELLQTQNINPETLKLIKYHHQNARNTGYPKIQDLYEHNEAADVLRAADIYSALRENRSYKNSLSPEQALSVINKEVSADNLNKDVYSALASYVEKTA